MKSLNLIEVQFIALGICVLFWICWVVADRKVRRFVRLKEPKLWQSFGFASSLKFSSLRSMFRHTEPSRRLGQWLKADGAKHMLELHPTFARTWRVWRLFETSLAVAILFLMGVSSWAVISYWVNLKI
jgi:hypothetical protein